MTAILPCFKCGRPLESAFPSVDDLPYPHPGTLFTAHGNYGSTAFDPPFGTYYLQLNICDDCLIAGQAVVYRVTETRSQPTIAYSAWDPEAEQ